MVLKGVKPQGMRREHMQLHVFNCLALLAVYPVCLLHQLRGNTYDPCVVARCNRAAKRLQQLHPLEEDDPESERATSTSTSTTSQEGTRNEMEHFFVTLSLQLEYEFCTSLSRSKVPSMAPQRIMYHLRNHLDNVADYCDLGTFRAPIIRENADALGIAGRESRIYAYWDFHPGVLLWVMDITTRVLCFVLPIQTCITLARAMMIRTSLEILGMSIIGATTITALSEMWRLWDPYDKGINSYSWTLGIAREIDAMLNDDFDSDRAMDKGLPPRKHGYDDWKGTTDTPQLSTADQELPRVVDALQDLTHQWEAMTCCRDGT
ncbi:hypothetical protein ACHAPT_006297 [Fusarium lateritium]